MTGTIDDALSAIRPALPFAIAAGLWSDDEARDISPEELLVYRSNFLGMNLAVTNFGGGNTSSPTCAVSSLPVTV